MTIINLRRILVIAGPLVLAGAAPVAAQSSRRIEAAAQTTVLRQSSFDATTPGIGGRVTFDLARWIAVESEFSFFPNDTINLKGGLQTATYNLAYHRRRADGLFGVKAGVRTARFGVFGKVRPGFTKLTDEGMGCTGPLCAFSLFARPVYRTEFALDTGGVLEIYPSGRSVVRFDIGDVMIRHRSFAPPCSTCTSHNVTSRAGVGWRF